MAQRRSKTRRREPSEKHKPFFEKDSTSQGQFFFGDRKAVQYKLAVGKVDDVHEKEADAAARHVMQQPVQRSEKKEEEKPVQKQEKKEEEKPVQKAEKKEEEKPVQKQEKKEEEKPVQKMEKEEEVQAKRIQRKVRVENMDMVQTKEADEKATSMRSIEETLKQQKGRGEKIPDTVREEMEGNFKTTFGHVRIHTDKAAADMCQQLHAVAFTHGSDIYFDDGQYNPNSPAGKELLAHELAHVVQQRC